MNPITYSWFPAPSPFAPGLQPSARSLFSKRAVHPWPTPRPLRPPPPRRRCAAATRSLRRHALELLVRQAPRWHRAPAVMCQVHMTAAARDAHLWTCSQASHARQQAGAARAPLHRLLFQPQVLPDSSGACCCSPGVWRPRSSPRVCAYGFVAFRRGACRVLGLILRRSHILWRCQEPGGYAVACVWVLLGTGTFVGTRILFGPRASGPQTSFRMAPPRERGARATRLASTASTTNLHRRRE